MSRVEGCGVLEEMYSFCPPCSYRDAAGHLYSARAGKCSRLPSATSLSPRSQLFRVCRVLLAPPALLLRRLGSWRSFLRPGRPPVTPGIPADPTGPMAISPPYTTRHACGSCAKLTLSLSLSLSLSLCLSYIYIYIYMLPPQRSMLFTL